MILADTSIWVDHLRAIDPLLEMELCAGRILGHPFVTGEVALGHLRNRASILANFQELPRATVASDSEALHLIERARLFGRGIGYIDAHLLAATQLTPNAALWTRDRSLRDIARQLGIAHPNR